jgi:hypothetical protein
MVLRHLIFLILTFKIHFIFRYLNLDFLLQIKSFLIMGFNSIFINFYNVNKFYLIILKN